MTDLSSIRQELEKSRRDVLDLSLRNPLLNFRPTKRRGIEVVDERSRELFRILVGGPVPAGSSSRSPRVMYFRPAHAETARPAPGEPAADDLDDVPSELLAMLGELDDDPDGAAARHTDNRLQTALPRAALNLRLRQTFRQARLSGRGTGGQHPLSRPRDAHMVRVREQQHRAPRAADPDPGSARQVRRAGELQVFGLAHEWGEQRGPRPKMRD